MPKEKDVYFVDCKKILNNATLLTDTVYLTTIDTETLLSTIAKCESVSTDIHLQYTVSQKDVAYLPTFMLFCEAFFFLLNAPLLYLQPTV